jgi:hypothetical protein
MYLGHEGVAPKLGSDNITRCDRATYLGMSFANTGLDFKFSNEKGQRMPDFEAIC